MPCRSTRSAISSALPAALPFARELIGQGKQVFLDLKLHDIGNTVEKGVESVAKLGATFLTVHAYPQTMKAAVTGKGASKLKILAVTVLTSYDDSDLRRGRLRHDRSASLASAARATGARHRRRRPGLFAGRSRCFAQASPAIKWCW